MSTSFLMKAMLVAIFATSISGCIVVADHDSNASENQKVSKNAQEAEAKCGKNNVKSVSLTGFECKQ